MTGRQWVFVLGCRRDNSATGAAAEHRRGKRIHIYIIMRDALGNLKTNCSPCSTIIINYLI